MSKILFTAVAGILLLGLSMQTAAAEPAEQQGLVDKARLTFQSFMSDKNMDWLHANLDQANALGASNKNIKLELNSSTLDSGGPFSVDTQSFFWNIHACKKQFLALLSFPPSLPWVFYQPPMKLKMTRRASAGDRMVQRSMRSLSG